MYESPSNLAKGLQPSQGSEFLAAAGPGRHSWKAYLGTLLLILFAFFAYAYGSARLLVSLGIGPAGLTALPPNALFLLNIGAFVFVLAGLLAGVGLIHGRRLASLVTAAPRARWSRLLLAAGVWLALSAASEVVLYLLYPGNYSFSFEPGAFFTFLPLALIFIPIQSATEELLFRGYLLQGLGRWTRRPWLAVLLTSLLFGALHGANPEVLAYGPAAMFAYYIGFGLFAAIITLLSGGVELATGLHIANNLYGALAVTYPSSALKAPALITLRSLNPYGMLAVWAATSALFFLLLVRRRRSG